MTEQDQKQEKNEEASPLIAYESSKQAKLAAQREIDTLTAEFLKNGNKITELPHSGIQKDYVGKVSYGNDYSGSINGAW